MRSTALAFIISLGMAISFRLRPVEMGKDNPMDIYSRAIVFNDRSTIK